MRTAFLLCAFVSGPASEWRQEWSRNSRDNGVSWWCQLPRLLSHCLLPCPPVGDGFLTTHFTLCNILSKILWIWSIYHWGDSYAIHHTSGLNHLPEDEVGKIQVSDSFDWELIPSMATRSAHIHIKLDEKRNCSWNGHDLWYQSYWLRRKHSHCFVCIDKKFP